MIRQGSLGILSLSVVAWAFNPNKAFDARHLNLFKTRRSFPSCLGLQTTNEIDDTSTLHAALGIQILISDTGGGHRASAYAIRDALDFLYPGRFGCDIVDIYTDYGAVWPYNDYVSIYKYMAANPWMWSLLYEFGKSEFGLWFNQVMLENFCTNSFKSCLSRPNPATGRRADMVVSIHPLTQDLPLKILSQLDSQNGITRRTTPFCTVVTDLGSAHPTWFNPGYVFFVYPWFWYLHCFFVS
jgi:Monogalactosyldiacylglycerol (MGDG) synthase